MVTSHRPGQIRFRALSFVLNIHREARKHIETRTILAAFYKNTVNKELSYYSLLGGWVGISLFQGQVRSTSRLGT